MKARQPLINRINPRALLSCGVLLLSLVSGCAADPTSDDSEITDPVDAEITASKALKSARIHFHYSDFYTLTHPNAASCAGDAKTYYNPIATTTASDSSNIPVAYTSSEFYPGETIRPSFIKNISVDMTDTGTISTSNKAYGCSMGSGPSSPPVSNCATFDYAALGGISSGLSGSLIMMGGVEDSSGDTTSYTSEMYALGVNRLPASVFATNPDLMPAYAGTDGPSGPVSSWSKLSGANGYTGPSATAGAAASYDGVLQKILLFGGAAPLSSLSSDAGGMTTYDTWVYDLKQQTWNTFSNNVIVDTQLSNLFDVQLDIRANSGANNSPDTGTAAPFSVQVPKAPKERALFGYVAAPGMAMKIDQMTTTGTMTNTLIDKTDRLMIIGGQNASGVLGDTLRFNPTYGPDIMDGMGTTGGITLGTSTGNGLDLITAGVARQWIDSYHTQSLNNSYGIGFSATSAVAPGYRYSSKSSLHRPDLSPLASGVTGGDRLFNGGYAAALNITPGADGVDGTGYVVAAGGFDASTIDNTAGIHVTDVNVGVCSDNGNPSGTGGTATLNCGGTLSILGRFSLTTSDLHEKQTAFWSVIPNFIDLFKTPNAPAIWTQLSEATDATTNQTVPWVGGSALVPGFDLTTNEMVYFGGLKCRNYVSDTTASCAGFSNPGRYWRLTADPASLTAVQVPIAMAGVAPVRAGMAVARGFDISGNTIIVAWGGATGAATTLSTDTFNYLYDNAGVPTWVSTTGSSTSKPAQLINASLVYSHVTGKFYLFGGYDAGTGVSRGETWELTVGGTGCAAAGNGNCTFSWNQLTPTCYPASTCPVARRSHRMAEVNYYNTAPTALQTCTAGAPCSYGIFMEGGTPNGLSYLGDRWMFDPTGNDGEGHWLKMTEMPPRMLASMANSEYTVQQTTTVASRAVLFGGETGLFNPSQGITGNSYVAPTLGDTWMFDYAANTWNRVQLLGKGYNGVGNLPTDSDFERRQSYDATDPDDGMASPYAGPPAHDLGLGIHQSELSPPPISGGIMVTRTMSPPVGSLSSLTVPADGVLHKLAIPEMYLFGGRTKDGLFLPLDHVYKFCAGSTGEAFGFDFAESDYSFPNINDYSCDAYDPDGNPYSPNPVSGYVGRWLRKDPDGVDNGAFFDVLNGRTTLAATGFYLGAGAYDSIRDRIVLFGGWQPNGSFSATNTASLALFTDIYEYTPPQPQLVNKTPASTSPREGRWTSIPVCQDANAATYTTIPEGRYGHTLAYDTLTHKLVLVGGFDSDGTALTKTQTYYATGATYLMPEVWTATYYSADTTAESNSVESGVAIIVPGVEGCYHWAEIENFGNAIGIPSQAPPLTGLSHAASIFVPSVGYNTGYYTMLDNACEKAGPIGSTDPTQNKLLAGGAYIDIDRAELGTDENLLLNLTYLPLGTSNLRPDGQNFEASESAVFKIHLIRTGLSSDTIQQTLQPRHMTFTDPGIYPQVAQSLSVIAPPTGQITQEQVLIPLSADPTIDRIRIERYSGSGILLEASIFRLGSK